jgi:hypothetical protein
MKDFINNVVMFEMIYDYIFAFCKISGIYVVWIFLHYLSAHAYVCWCVPATIIGFIATPFMIPAPHCQALRWLIYNGGNFISAMWVVIGAWAMRYLAPS